MEQIKSKCWFWSIGMRMIVTTVVILVCFFGKAYAFVIPTENQNVDMRWDNTFTYNYAVRTQSPNEALLKNVNMDDGDRNFNKGTVVNRLDILSEFDMVFHKTYGFRVSGAFWYDQRVFDSLGNDSVLTSNHIENGRQALGLSDRAKRNAGADAELLDAFLFGKVDLGSVPVNLKIGRHTVFYGEALFTPQSISYGQMPVDYAKSLAMPGATLKELFRPVFNVSMQAQLTNTLSFAAQQFLEWEPNRLAEGGTYLGSTDLLTYNEAALFAPGVFVPHGKDVEPYGYKNFGLNLRWAPEWLGGTMGVYYRRFADVLPQVAFINGGSQFINMYADGISLFGISATKEILGYSLSAELSYRHNMPLNSLAIVVAGGAPDRGDTLGPEGDTVHGVLSLIRLFGGTPLWDTSTLQAEVNWTHLAHLTQNPQLYQGNDSYTQIDKPTDNAFGANIAFTPAWLQIFPGMDLSMPLSWGGGLYGNSAVAAGTNEHGGTWGAGLSLDMYQKYTMTLSYTSYYGQLAPDPGVGTVANGFYAGLKDRDTINFTFKTTF